MYLIMLSRLLAFMLVGYTETGTAVFCLLSSGDNAHWRYGNRYSFFFRVDVSWQTCLCLPAISFCPSLLFTWPLNRHDIYSTLVWMSLLIPKTTYIYSRDSRRKLSWVSACPQTRIIITLKEKKVMQTSSLRMSNIHITAFSWDLILKSS